MRKPPTEITLCQGSRLHMVMYSPLWEEACPVLPFIRDAGDMKTV